MFQIGDILKTDRLFRFCGGKRHVRHIFGSKVSPRFIEQIARDNRIQFHETVNSVDDDSYMNDYLESSSTVNEENKKAQDLWLKC